MEEKKISKMSPHQQVIHDLRLIFVHVPKTGGRFVERVLQLLASPGQAYLAGHHTILEFADAVTYTSFAVVRHPYDRLWSAFHYLKAGGSNHVDREHWRMLGSPSRFEQLVDNLCSLGPDLLKRPWHTHLVPQYLYLSDARGRVVVTHVLHYETLEEDLRALVGRVTDDHARALLTQQLVNRVNVRPPYPRTATAATMAKIQELYCTDFELFYDKVSEKRGAK